ncbi:hypothetical protein ACFX2I_037689 [Malus domestica]
MERGIPGFYLLKNRPESFVIRLKKGKN